MAFPQVEQSATSTEASNTTTHTITIPTVSSGELIIVIFCADSPGETTTWPSSNGWYDGILVDEAGSAQTADVVYRESDGTEAGTIDVTTSGSEQSASIVYVISGWDSATPPEISSTTGQNANPDPPSVTPSWGADDNLYIAGQTNNDGTSTVTAYPSNYTSNQLNATTGSAGGTCAGGATREVNGSPENPGSFTISASEHWVAFTIAVKPGAAGPTYEADLTTGSYTLTGQNPTVDYNRVADLTAGSYTQTGQDPTVSYNRVADLTTGSYTLTGNDITVSYNRVADLTTGSYTLSGQDPTVSYNRVGDLTTGSYTLTGQDPDVNYNPAGGPTYTADLTTGSYTLTGQTLTVSYNRVADLTTGSFTWSGLDPTASYNRVADLTAGVYTLTGNDVTTVYSWVADLTTGTYTLTGQTVTATYSGEILGATVELSDAALYTVAVNDAAVYTVAITDSGVYVLTLADEIL